MRPLFRQGNVNSYPSLLESPTKRGTGMAQSVKHLTLDFGSGQDLMVMRLSPMSDSVLGMESA